VLSGRIICDKLTTHLQESYRLWCVAVCDIETSFMRIRTSINWVELKNRRYEGWNFNSGNYLFTTDTK